MTEPVETLVALADEIPVRYELVEGSQLGGEMSKGGLTKVSRKGAEARLENPVPPLSNLKMRIIRDGKEMPGTLYGKVLGAAPGNGTAVSIRFTSVSPEIETLLRGLTAASSRAGDNAATAKGGSTAGL
jgi:hypothetical protein